MIEQPLTRRVYAVAKRVLPGAAARAIRAGFTATVTPFAWSARTGHWRSSLSERAVTSNGDPLPWYTYPAISFLEARASLADHVLEFGAGQSTLWWSKNARYVVALEGDRKWADEIRQQMSWNTDLRVVDEWPVEACVTSVRRHCAGRPPFDVIAIDGLQRVEMCKIAVELRAPTGIIICDNAEGYNLWDAMKPFGLQRVDFWGNAPGVLRPHCTSIYFSAGTPWFAP